MEVVADICPMESRIAIIGAGVSGLAIAKQLGHHNPVVFEASDSVGGVWRSCSYNSTKLQSSRADYEFSDFPWPDRDNHDFPTYKEVIDYLESYAKHHNLFKFIKFNSKVVNLNFITQTQHDNTKSGDYGRLLSGQSRWEVAVQTNNDPQSVQVGCTRKFYFILWCG